MTSELTSSTTKPPTAKLLLEKQQALFPLKCSLQNYEWGKQGSKSLVAQLAPEATGHEFKLDEKEYYAELWMGTHSNGPSSLLSSPSTTLHDLIASAPSHHLGQTLHRKFPKSTHVPFLFKILSIAKALPLQAHPDKALGEKLHQRDNKEFVDPNHKPEIALAIEDGFRGFVGFRPVEEVAAFVRSLPEVQEAIGDPSAVKAFLQAPSKDGMKDIFTKLLMQPQEKITPIAEKLVQRCKAEGGAALGGKDFDEMAQVVVQIEGQYPGDVGILAATVFLNLVKLDKGEAVYIGADEVHAYLEGDIIECMAISDNVLNAAFVPPEERDIKTFTSMLTYTARGASYYTLPRGPYAKSETGRTTRYDPPLEEFDVLWTTLEEEGRMDVLGAVQGPTVGIVVNGSVRVGVNHGTEAVVLKKGGVVYVRAGTPIQVQTLEPTADVYWAICDA